MKVIRESYEVSKELEDVLNSILADEYLASCMYKFASIAVQGNKQHRIDEIADENGKDELDDHFANLVTWMQSKGLKVVTSLREMEKITNCTKFDIVDGADSSEILDMLITSEEEAIDVYEKVLERDDVKLDLATMLAGFLKDEREHLKELTDIKNELGGSRGSMRKVDESALAVDPYFGDDYDLTKLDEEQLMELKNIIEIEIEKTRDFYNKTILPRARRTSDFKNSMEDYKMKMDMLRNNNERVDIELDAINGMEQGYDPIEDGE